MIYTIKKGSHYARFAWLRLLVAPFRFMYLRTGMYFDVMFHRHETPKKFDLSWNKLYGWSYWGLVHRNSIRIAWHYIPNAATGYLIRVEPYIYRNGERTMSLPNLQPNAGILVPGRKYTIFMSIASGGKHIIIELLSESRRSECIWTIHKGDIKQSAIAFRNYPYYGGKETAPSDIKIEITNEILL